MTPTHPNVAVFGALAISRDTIKTTTCVNHCTLLRVTTIFVLLYRHKMLAGIEGNLIRYVACALLLQATAAVAIAEEESCASPEKVTPQVRFLAHVSPQPLRSATFVVRSELLQLQS
jgi:hypothetical protein